MQTERKEYIFSHTFMVLCWNLMCKSAVSICYSHMEWRNDALEVFFAHMKNDQNGERPRDARHIYANPMCPSNSNSFTCWMVNGYSSVSYHRLCC
jgi:hypothetical protein